MSEMKEEDNTLPLKYLNEIEISSLPDKGFKVMVIKMFNKLRRRINVHSENINEEIENI